MGCGGSKAEDLPLVIRCRQRKSLIKAAADHRFALAAAHVSYFHSLNDVGDALRRFVDQELAIPSPSSPAASPVLTLPSDQPKKKKNQNKQNSSSSSTSLSHSGSGSHIHLSDEDDDHHDHHMHLSSSASSSDSELDSSLNHPHMRYSPEIIEQPPPPYPHSYYNYPPPPQTGWGPEVGGWGVHYPPPQTDWGGQFGVSNPTYSTTHTNTNYMKRSTPQVQSVIYDPAATEQRSSYYSYTNSSYPSYYPDQNNTGFFGFLMRSPPREPQNQQPSPPPGPPPPPSPKVSGWDFLNPFDMFDSGGYSGYYSFYGNDVYGSIASSPDSNEVREREGIPDLEDETEPETFRRGLHHHHHHRKGKKKLSQDNRKNYSGEGTSWGAVPSQKQKRSSTEGSSRPVPLHKESSEGSSSKTALSHGSSSEGGTHRYRGIHFKEAPSDYDEVIHSVDVKEEKSSPDTIILTNSTEDGSVRKKGVTFEVNGGLSTRDVESSKLSSFTTLSAHGTRDIREVVAEIRDEFATASTFSKEVAMLLEVGRLPYQSRFTLLGGIVSSSVVFTCPTFSTHNMCSSRVPVEIKLLRGE